MTRHDCHLLLSLIGALTASVVFSGCAPRASVEETVSPRTVAIVAINDIYRIEGVSHGAVGGLARVRALRRRLEERYGKVLLLHAGDALSPSPLSSRYESAQMIDVMNRLDGATPGFDASMFVTIGNHEFDRARREDAPYLDRAFATSEFTWLGTNVEFEDGAITAGTVSRKVIVTSGGLRVGIFGITTDLVRPAYVRAFGEPVKVARETTAALRAEGAEVVVAVTHLDLADDERLLSALGEEGPDLVIGGHDHSAAAKKVGDRWIFKSDSDAVTARIVTVSREGGAPPIVRHELVRLEGEADPEIVEVVDEWHRRFDRDRCTEDLKLPAGCLSDELGRTATVLDGEETTIRRFETGLGNWVADCMRTHAFPGAGADVAFVNAGLLRLNDRILPEHPVTRGDLDALVGFPSPLVLLRAPVSLFEQVASHSVQGWTGRGKWLQISGFSFSHDPVSERVLRVGFTPRDGAAPSCGGSLLAVTTAFLADPATGQDGYRMITPDLVVERGPDLEVVLARCLEASGGRIAPREEGRICNIGEGRPCGAQSSSEECTR